MPGLSGGEAARYEIPPRYETPRCETDGVSRVRGAVDGQARAARRLLFHGLPDAGLPGSQGVEGGGTVSRWASVCLLALGGFLLLIALLLWGSPWHFGGSV